MTTAVRPVPPMRVSTDIVDILAIYERQFDHLDCNRPGCCPAALDATTEIAYSEYPGYEPRFVAETIDCIEPNPEARQFRRHNQPKRRAPKRKRYHAGSVHAHGTHRPVGYGKRHKNSHKGYEREQQRKEHVTSCQKKVKCAISIAFAD